jgi:hypothetical protein
MEKSKFVARVEACSRCHFAHQNVHSLECRLKPPHVQPLIGVDRGMPKHIGTLSLFPPVGDDNWCGEFVSARQEAEPKPSPLLDGLSP